MSGGTSAIALGIGALLAATVGVFANIVGYDRDRVFYATVLTVVGSLYVLFAVMVGAGQAIILEIAFFCAFAAIAAIGFRSSPWIVVAGLALHGVFDFVRHYFMSAPGAPEWWPAFCGSYDIAASLWLAMLLRIRRSPADHSLRR